MADPLHVPYTGLKHLYYSDFTPNMDVHPDTGDLFRYTNVGAVKESLRNILLTDKYDRPYNFDIGCNIRQLLFENISGDLMSIASDQIKKACTYEPRAQLKTVKIVATPDQETITITITFLVLNIAQIQTLTVTLNRVR